MIQTIHVMGSTGDSQILVGGSLEQAGRLITAPHTAIITDATVRALHGHRFFPGEVIEIGQGESQKTLETVRSIYERLLAMGADRSWFILGMGGGIVCDVAGFAASTFLRGLRFGFCATTLLSQVDASVGGKNGVNFFGYKNMVGVFRQPEFVVCDPDVLATLPARELCSGFAEIIKHAAIADVRLFSYLEENRKKALDLDRDVLSVLVHDSVDIKSGVVRMDETEKGPRRILNFGHTFGHALENTSQLSHGEAVSVGMVLAARLSVQKGLLAQEDAIRLEKLLAGFGLPVRVPVDLEKALDALKKDKKREGDHILFVLLAGLGQAKVVPISIQELEAVMRRF